jgi:hypothetical protein
MKHTVFAALLALGSATVFTGPAFAQTAQQPTATAPGAASTSTTAAPSTAPTTATTTPGAGSMPMQQMGHGPGMGMSGGQGHPGPMMGGQNHPGPMGTMPPCPAGQTASGTPPTCQ